MAQKISVGIDIGTYQVKVVIGAFDRASDTKPRIIGTGSASSRGMRYGYIVNTNDVAKSIKKAVKEAEGHAGITVTDAFLSVGGVSLESTTSIGSTIISRGDNEITELDIENALKSSEQVLPKAKTINKRILHAIPLKYKLDGREVLGRPVGMKGVKLEVEVLFITYLEQHLGDLVQAVEQAGIDVVDIIAAPLAASIVTLTKAQKIAGCVLTNIGSETVSIVVYENNTPISMGVFPIGSTDITNDIALGLKIPLEEAEQLKKGGFTGHHYSRKKLDEIIVARLKDIFELIEAHLKESGKNALLPAGIVITGGGSSMATVEDLARATLNLPSKISHIHFPASGNTRVRDASWSVSYGLVILGLTGSQAGAGIRLIKETKKGFIEWIKKFLP